MDGVKIINNGLFYLQTFTNNGIAFLVIFDFSFNVQNIYSFPTPTNLECTGGLNIGILCLAVTNDMLVYVFNPDDNASFNTTVPGSVNMNGCISLTLNSLSNQGLVAISYEVYFSSNSSYNIYAGVFTDNMTIISEFVYVSNMANGQEIKLTNLTNGGFALSWMYDANNITYMSAIFDQNYNQVGTPFQVSTAYCSGCNAKSRYYWTI